MYAEKTEFIEDIQSIFKPPFYYSEIEHSFKITEHSTTNNRCIVMIYKYAYPDRQTNSINKIPTYTYFSKNTIISKLNETKYYKPKLFQNFINDTLFHHTCKSIIFGVDIDNHVLKFYLSLKNNNKDTSILKCMEIELYGKTKYKLYDSIDSKEHFHYINNLLFGKNKFILNNNLNDIYDWGYYRNEITNNEKSIYGLDIMIDKPILKIKSSILKIIQGFNMLNLDSNNIQIVKFLKDNRHKTLFWLGVNYKNSKRELCLYYRDT